LSDEQIRARRAGDPNFPRIDWKSVDVELVEPISKTHVSIRLDSDIVDFFKSKGKGYQTRINQVLRSYVDHEEKAG
tara:strand:+ start:448 stop:675 length:228 start_codon:yes stop_codon:yes gene_type:complete